MVPRPGIDAVPTDRSERPSALHAAEDHNRVSAAGQPRPTNVPICPEPPGITIFKGLRIKCPMTYY